MLAKDVKQLLGITPPTLTKYVKEGRIRVTVMPNNRYNYNDEDVEAIAYKGLERKTVIYARVSTAGQKASLESQVDMLKQFCFSSGYKLHGVYQEVASGINFDTRKQLFAMMDEVLNRRIARVVIAYKDRLSRIGFSLFVEWFKRFNCEIIVMSEVGSTKLDSEEIFEEIVSLLHCYSMKLYSRRRIQKIKAAIEETDD